jgi:outer membrane protein assembly factor BamB
MVRCCTSLLIGFLVFAGDVGADWPQYRGPNRDDVSLEKGLRRSWPAEGPKVLWTIPVGKGYAGPAVKDGSVYLLDRIAGTGDVLRCL